MNILKTTEQSVELALVGTLLVAVKTVNMVIGNN